MRNFDKLRHFEYFEDIKKCLDECSTKIIDIYDKSDNSIIYKEDNSPLTQADLISHELIENKLKNISPYPLISEESNNHYLEARKYWLIDPLDGTKEFINKNGEFTINIALIENEYPVIGYVFSPTTQTLYVGGLNKKSFKIQKGKVEEISASLPHNPIRIVASRSHLNDETQNYINQFKNFELLQVGSSIKFCIIAEGLADIYPRFAPTSEWDTAASQAVVEGAGGTVVDIHENRLSYRKKNILNPFFIVNGKK
tara:strand:+ start:199 stop:963 length:765 start_codon:yes stop_codon:yes gene_type:complete